MKLQNVSFGNENNTAYLNVCIDSENVIINYTKDSQFGNVIIPKEVFQKLIKFMAAD